MKKTYIATFAFSVLLSSNIHATNFINDVSIEYSFSPTPCTDQWVNDVEVMVEVNQLTYEQASKIADKFFYECLDIYYPY